MRKLDIGVYIDVPVATVYNHLSEPGNFLGLQPLLVEMSPVQRTVEKGLSVVTYETVEAFRWWKFTYHNRIRVRMVMVEPNVRLETAVNGNLGVHLNVVYRFTEENGGTRLTETMEIKASRLLMGFVYSQALAAQEHTLNALKQRLENK